MSATPPLGDNADLRAQLAENIFQNTDVSANLGGRIIMCTEDKVRLAVHSHLERMRDAHEWWAPAGLLIPVLAALCTADFKPALGLSAATWTAMFLIAAIFSGLWLLRALYMHKRAPSEEDFIAKLKPTTSPQPTPPPARRWWKRAG